MSSSAVFFIQVGKNFKRVTPDVLSGGERTRLSLSALLSERPELLILDEPTNHLDFSGVERLASELLQYKGTVIVVSHDRYFMDSTISRIIELDNGLAKSYGGNYTYYRQQKKREYEEQLHQYSVQEKRKDALEAEIERVRMWAAKSHREAGKKGKMAENKKGSKQDLQKGYQGRTLFAGSSFYLLHGDRTGIVGPNGCGKSTLLRLITGAESADSGEIWMSPTAGAIYISQDVKDLDPVKRPLDLLEEIPGINFGKARQVFASLGIDAAMFFKKLGCLSQGERMRVKLAMAILEGSGFLILDEPTNHLDLFSRERLEDSLDEYDGTILMVSHDRYMLERVCDKLLVFENGCIKPFYGSFGQYLASKAVKAPEKKDECTPGEKLLIENRIAAIVGRLSALSQEDPAYRELDREFNELTLRKQKLGL